MKAKNILMTLLLVTGAIAAKAAGYPPELALVSQPVMVYNANSITVYYDVENIGDYTYKGSVYIYLDPDAGYYYADKWVKVYPGRIKRIAIDIPANRIRRGHPFTIMPYYELGDELYSFTTFEYFEPITFYWDGPRNERWVVINVAPCLHYYHRPGTFRYYYDGFRPPMPPRGHAPRPMNPKHHTYAYHHNNGGYPANHNHHHGDHGPKPNDHGDGPKPHDNGDNPKPHDNNSATVRPNANAGSMSHGSNNAGSSNNGGSNSGGSNSGSKISRPSSSSSSSSTSRPSGTSSGERRSSSVSNSSSTSRPSSSNSSSVSRPSSNSSNRPSGTSSSSSSSSRGSSSNFGSFSSSFSTCTSFRILSSNSRFSSLG